LNSDPAAYIVSANLNRRNMTKGQQAMALAMIYPETGAHKGKKNPATKVLETSSFSRQRLDQARQVLHHSRALAEQVLAGSMSLDEALLSVRQAQNKIQAVQDEVQSEEARSIEKRLIHPLRLWGGMSPPQRDAGPARGRFCGSQPYTEPRSTLAAILR